MIKCLNTWEMRLTYWKLHEFHFSTRKPNCFNYILWRSGYMCEEYGRKHKLFFFIIKAIIHKFAHTANGFCSRELEFIEQTPFFFYLERKAHTYTYINEQFNVKPPLIRISNSVWIIIKQIDPPTNGQANIFWLKYVHL